MKLQLSGGDALLKDLRHALKGSITEDKQVAPHTSFKIGGPADLWIEPSDLEDLATAVRLVHRAGWPLMVIGNGTNCLVSDRGIRGAVISMSYGFRRVNIKGCQVTAGAGVSMPLLSHRVARAGLTGYEWACGIPGSIGGSIVMNAGAHGNDTAASLLEAEVVSSEGEGGWIPSSDFDFAYRHSNVLEQGIILTAGRFCFEVGDPKVIQERLNEYRRKRRSAQPNTSLCAGSVFRNPPDDSAGRILGSLGASGMRCGQAQVSEKHANFIINTGSASASDVASLICRLKTMAKERAGVDLQTEVLLLGDWDEEWNRIGEN